MTVAKVGATAAAALLQLSIAHAGDKVTPDWAGAAFGETIRGPAVGGNVSTDDLLRMRNLGGFALSPDGRWLAFSVYQAVPEQNNYVLRWFFAPSDGASAPSAIEQDGGQPIPAYTYGVPHAYIPPEAPAWSPDGKRVAFRRLIDHRIELWSSDLATRRSTRVSDGAAQVSAFAWASDGTLVFRTGLNYARYEKNLGVEARHGWLLDGRVPLFTGRLKPTEPDCATKPSDRACDVKVFVFESRGYVRGATAGEAQALKGSGQGSAGGKAGLAATREDGAVASADAVEARYAGAAYPLRSLRTTAARARRCEASACAGAYFKEIGWARGGRSIWFIKSEASIGGQDGAPGDQKGFYEWKLKSSVVRQILSTDDRIEDCRVLNATAYCFHEGVKQPRQIVAIDINSGHIRVIANPNPQFSTKIFPPVRKLMLHDQAGNPAFAHVVYPVNYTPGRAYPLVVTQYRSKGFLRGNVGDEYPIYPLASEGFVVMDFDRPEQSILSRTADWSELAQAYSKNGRQLVLNAIEQGVDILIAEGLVDQRRMAITGLSAGAESVHYALQHTNRFAAAIASSGVQDLTFFALVPEGPQRTKLMQSFNTTKLIPAEGNSLYELAWSRMPDRLRTPLLINVGEREAMLGFEGFEALKHAKRPVEERIFPDEMHVKYQPQTYAGIYENNMMWLKFWLKGEEDPRPEFAAQYERWRSMRQDATSHIASSN